MRRRSHHATLPHLPAAVLPGLSQVPPSSRAHRHDQRIERTALHGRCRPHSIASLRGRRVASVILPANIQGGRTMATYNILLMGASYGSLLASKVLFGGHKMHLVCLPAEADLINAEGFRVRLPVKGRKDPVVIDSRKLPGKVTAGPASGVN